MAIPVMGAFPKRYRHNTENTIQIPRDRNGEFEPIIIPEHESRDLSIERLVISLYAKEVSVSDIEEELRDIYEITLSSRYFHHPQ